MGGIMTTEEVTSPMTGEIGREWEVKEATVVTAERVLARDLVYNDGDGVPDRCPDETGLWGIDTPESDIVALCIFVFEGVRHPKVWNVKTEFGCSPRRKWLR